MKFSHTYIIVRFCCLLAILVGASDRCMAQEKGFLPVMNYHQKVYNASAQNYACIEDLRGVMYFANNGGVLEYDGEEWNLIKTDRKATVKSLVLSKDGVIFVGAHNDFGYLKPNDFGKLGYHSLLHDSLAKEFGDIWCVVEKGEDIYFQANNIIFVWDGKTIREIHSEEILKRAFVVDDELYLVRRNLGLAKEVDGDIVQLSFEADSTEWLEIISILPYQGDEKLIVTKSDGIFIARLNDKRSFRRFKTELDEYLSNTIVHNAVRLPNELLSIGTWGDGIVLMNQRGELVDVVSLSTGLMNDVVLSQYVDSRNYLWLSLSNGLSKVDYSSPITGFEGVEGTIESIVRHKGKLYVGTQTGIYYLDNEMMHRNDVQINPKQIMPKLRKVEGIELATWGLYNFKSADEEILLVILDDGIYELTERTNRVKLVTKCIAYSFLQPKSNPNHVIVGTDKSVFSLIRKNGKWSSFDKQPDGINATVFNMLEVDNTIWLGTETKGCFGFEYNPTDYLFEQINIVHYDTLSGLPQGAIALGEKNGQVAMGCGEGLFVIEDKRVVRDESLSRLFGKDRSFHRIAKDQSGRNWFVTYAGSIFEVGFIEEDETTWVKNPFIEVSKGVVHAISHDDRGMSWLGGVDGLFRFDSEVPLNYEKPLNALIRKVVIGIDSTMFEGVFTNDKGQALMHQMAGESIEMEYAYNSFVFSFSCTQFNALEDNQYQVHLEGFDRGWTSWSNESKAVYTNMPEGDYVFMVKAKDIYGDISEEATYHFVILPPWYRTRWAYALYFVIFVGFIYGTVSLSTQGLKAIIKAKTAEITEQKEKIETQKKEVEEVNKEMVDSINYAKGIQDSILPSAESIKEHLKEAFVLFKPKDIVSGDFYWMVAKGDEVFFTAADCTGHGVPGAFVSMVGANGLNKSVNEYSLRSPAKILDSLTELVEETFLERKDGMDIALCCLNRKEKQLQFAGAQNPLWVVRKGDVQVIVDGDPVQPNIQANGYCLYEVKGSKQPIGAFEYRKPFDNYLVSVLEGDHIYVFTDGFPDQFGGRKGKKFMSKNLKKLLLSIQHKNVAEQRDALDDKIEEWMLEGNVEQIDDICMFCVKI